MFGKTPSKSRGGGGGIISTPFFSRNTNSMVRSLRCNSIPGDYTATRFPKCHNGAAVLTCENWCSNQYVGILMKLKIYFTWITIEKSG